MSRPKNVIEQVFEDKNLSIEAKAIYFYLSTNQKVNEHGISVSEICEDLQISDRRYKKHRKQLEENGYLTLKRTHDERGFSYNAYIF